MKKHTTPSKNSQEPTPVEVPENAGKHQNTKNVVKGAA